MVRPLVAKQTKVVLGTPDVPFALIPGLPLDTVYRRWFWMIPPVRRVIYDDGGWSAVGQRRTMVLQGGSAVAEVVLVDAPHVFRYRVASMKGLLKPLISHVDGRIDFVAVGPATEVTWQWTIHPKNVAAFLPVLMFARLWPAWAMKGLDYLAAQIGSTGS